jgi:hypothetical protein
MDTDDFSEMAYGIVCAAQVSDRLKADLGSRAARYKSEDDWLRCIRKFLDLIARKPEDYVDDWNLEQEEGVTSIVLRNLAMELSRRAEETLVTPLSWRRCPKQLQF